MRRKYNISKILCHKGYTMLEVVVAIFIFGCISTAIFKLIAHTDRIRGRVIFVENAVHIAANESERLRNIAVKNSVFEDSTFTEIIGEQSLYVERHIVTKDEINPVHPLPLEPVEIELTISNALHTEIVPIRFKLLMGNDHP